jgi:hypothetical protein
MWGDFRKWRTPMTKYSTAIVDGKPVTGEEVSRQDHTGTDLLSVIVTGGLAAFGDTTPDTVVVKTPDGSLHKGPEK